MLDSQDSRASSADPLIGRTLNNRFSIIEPLGAGGMGKVYRALQVPLDRAVALKVLSPSFPSSRDPGFQQRFLREASLSSKLRHPNTVTLIDYGQTDDGIYYIAMEYLDGRTLAQELSRVGPLPWMRALDIGQQVCRSLREAHNLGIVHRDLKPANVMLLNEADQDVVKVLDFGLVKSILPADEGHKSPEITQHGTFLGSPQYIAPEQARNVADARSDVYSLGVVLYQMLMGRPPFISKDYVEVIYSHVKESPPPFHAIRPDLAVPAPIENVVRKCLEKDPNRRFQNMDELLDGLREANRAAGGQSGVFQRSHLQSGLFPVVGTASVALARASQPDPSTSETVAVDVSVEIPGARVSRDWRRPLLIGGVIFVVLALFLTGARMLAVQKKATLAAMRRAANAERRLPSQPPVEIPVTTMPTDDGERSLGTGRSIPVASVQGAPLSSNDHSRPPVHFLLTSQPSGAHVYYKGKDQGVTPFVMDVLPEGEDMGVTVELTFMKTGYITEKVTAGGVGEVVLRQKLKKRPPPPKPVVQPAAPAVTAAPAAPAPSEAVLPFGEGMTRPERVKGTKDREIEYTPESLAAGVQGTMRVKCVITAQGMVENCRPIETVPLMEEVVLQALESRTYKPAMMQGKPVSVEYLFNIHLKPPQR